MKFYNKYQFSLFSSLLCLLLFPLTINAQETKIVRLLHSDKLIGINKSGNEVNILIGDVELEHDSTLFYCDSANLYKTTNTLDAFGNVHIIVNDSVNIYGDILYYDGNTKIAEIHNNVKLIDNTATLTTDHLKYYRKTKIANYYSGGKIVDKENELTSHIGYYYTDKHESFFKDSVVVINPDYIMHSDSLMYNTKNEIIYFKGASELEGEDIFMYCEDGWHDTQNDISLLKINSFLSHKHNSLCGDTIFYDKTKGYGEAFNNIIITDTVKDIIIKGNYAEYFKGKNFSYVTDSATAIFIDNTDSLFLHSDTIKVVFDSTQKAKTFFAYYKTKFFREGMQGMCDSLVYEITDSTISMYNNPVLWTEENQLSSDSIKIVTVNNQVDSIVFYQSAFIISRDDTINFNQVKGKIIVAYFKDNEIKKLTVNGNSESIYFVRDENENLTGIKKAVSSDILIFLKDKKMQTITYIGNPKTPMYPTKTLSPKELKLRNFIWHEDQRPKSVSD
ncbi:MAG: hypothetical protein K8R41_06950, partial [Bacteroidales bacterium]|nr:hypothetical protein [Bacteroidales bacterium]